MASFAPVPVAFGATVVGGIVDVATGQRAPAAIVIPALVLGFALARRSQSDALSFTPLVLWSAALAWWYLQEESINSIEVLEAIFVVVFSFGASIANMALVAIACAIVGWASAKPTPTRIGNVAGIVLVVFATAMCVLAIRAAVRRPTERAWVKAQPVVADWPDVTTVAEQRVQCGEKQVIRQRFDEKECALSTSLQAMPPSAYRGEPGDFGDFVRSCGPARIRCDASRSQAIAELADTGLIVYVTSAGEPSAHRGVGFEPKFAPAHVWWIWGVLGVLAAIGALVVRRPGFAVAFALFAGTPLAVALIVGRFA